MQAAICVKKKKKGVLYAQVYTQSYKHRGVSAKIKDEFIMGPSRWLGMKRHLLPRLMTWVQPLGPTW